MFTIETDHIGDFDSFHHEFRRHVTSDDGAISECWVAKLKISDPDLQEFDSETFWVDPDTGEEYAASPIITMVKDEVECLWWDAMHELNAAINPADPWSDAGVSQADFL